MSDIRPALTAKEWADESMDRQSPYAPYAPYDIEAIPNDIEVVCVDDGALCVSGEHMFNSADRHALASLALHEQSFGFTHDDCALLRSIARSSYESIELRDLADRIEALLPPREKT